MTPKISIVTPVLNQQRYLADALNSVIEQRYPNLEYIVVDGGSMDGSVEIIDHVASHLAVRISEPDQGMYDALNKGFAESTGEIMGWLNADDMQTPWALHVVAEVFSSFPEVLWATTAFPLFWDAKGRAVKCLYNPRLSRQGFLRGENLPGAGGYATGWIQQESTFWRRSLWEAAGGYMDSSMQLAGDFELWSRFFERTDLYGIATPLGGFRQHGDQKSVNHMADYLREATHALIRTGGRVPSSAESYGRRIMARLATRPLGVRKVNICVFDPVSGQWKIERS